MKAFRTLLKLVERHLTWLHLLTGGSLLTAAGWISKISAERTTWIVAQGPFVVWGAAVVGAAAAGGVYALAGLGYDAFVRARATARWLDENFDLVNPLDEEFHRRRIRLADLVSPITNSIQGKRFYQCELVGPYSLLMLNCNIAQTAFTDCNIINVRLGEAVNSATMIDCLLSGCRIGRANLFIFEQFLPALKQGVQGAVILGDPGYQPPQVAEPAA